MVDKKMIVNKMHVTKMIVTNNNNQIVLSKQKVRKLIRTFCTYIAPMGNQSTH